MRKRLRQTWQSLTIRKKIATFTGTVFLIIMLSVIFEVWVVKFSLLDFNAILQDNAKSSGFLEAMEQESQLFESYMKNDKEEDRELLDAAIKRTKNALADLPFEYGKIGEARYAKTWSIRNSYEVYCTKRDAVLTMCLICRIIYASMPEYL